MGGQKDLRNRTNRETKPKPNQKIGQPNRSVRFLFLFYTILSFGLGLGLQNTKIVVLVNQPKNKKKYKYYTKIIKFNGYNIHYENKFIYRSTM